MGLYSEAGVGEVVEWFSGSRKGIDEGLLRAKARKMSWSSPSSSSVSLSSIHHPRPSSSRRVASEPHPLSVDTNNVRNNSGNRARTNHHHRHHNGRQHHQRRPHQYILSAVLVLAALSGSAQAHPCPCPQPYLPARGTDKLKPKPRATSLTAEAAKAAKGKGNSAVSGLDEDASDANADCGEIDGSDCNDEGKEFGSGTQAEVEFGFETSTGEVEVTTVPDFLCPRAAGFAFAPTRTSFLSAPSSSSPSSSSTLSAPGVVDSEDVKATRTADPGLRATANARRVRTRARKNANKRRDENCSTPSASFRAHLPSSYSTLFSSLSFSSDFVPTSTPERQQTRDQSLEGRQVLKEPQRRRQLQQQQKQPREERDRSSAVSFTTATASGRCDAANNAYNSNNNDKPEEGRRGDFLRTHSQSTPASSREGASKAVASSSPILPSTSSSFSPSPSPSTSSTPNPAARLDFSRDQPQVQLHPRSTQEQLTKSRETRLSQHEFQKRQDSSSDSSRSRRSSSKSPNDSANNPNSNDSDDARAVWYASSAKKNDGERDIESVSTSFNADADGELIALYTARTIPDRYELGTDGLWHKVCSWTSSDTCGSGVRCISFTFFLPILPFVLSWGCSGNSLFRTLLFAIGTAEWNAVPVRFYIFFSIFAFSRLFRINSD